MNLPNASKSFKILNPGIFGQHQAEEGVQPILESAKGNVEHYEDQINSELQCSKSKRHKKESLGKAVPGKTEGVRRTTVRFVGYRTRPLDPDNFAAGCKDLLDGLRHASLLSGDEPWKITFETEQVKVSHRWQEKTEITISDIANP